MSNESPEISEWEAATVKNTVRLGIWTAAWVISLAIGVGMILANKHHLQGLDELQRNMQLEAMAVSLGVGLITGLAFSTMDVVNLIHFDAEISHMVLLMSITYAISLAISRRKYR